MVIEFSLVKRRNTAEGTIFVLDVLWLTSKHKNTTKAGIQWELSHKATLGVPVIMQLLWLAIANRR
jgi:hypothetical protein